MINPVHLRSFVALVDVGHYTKAAQHLNMTQPGLSQHIQRLEKDLQISLLVKSGKSFELTRAGFILYEYALEQAEGERLLQEKLFEDHEAKGCVTIACSGGVAIKIYPELLKIQKQYPALKMHLEASPREKIEEGVASGQYDTGLVSISSDEPGRRDAFTYEAIGEDTLMLVLPKGEAASWKRLQELGFIDHPDGARYARPLLSTNYVSGYAGMESLPISGYVNQIHQILLPVTMGQGFTVLPASAVESYDGREDLKIASLTHEITETIYWVYRSKHPLPKRYKTVKHVVAECLRQK